MAFDELTCESFVWGIEMRTADAIALNLPPPPEDRRPVSETTPLH